MEEIKTNANYTSVAMATEWAAADPSHPPYSDPHSAASETGNGDRRSFEWLRYEL